MARTRPHDTAVDSTDITAVETSAVDSGDPADDAAPSHEDAVAAVAVRDDRAPDATIAPVDVSDWTDEEVTHALTGRGWSTDGTAAERAARLTSTDDHGGATS